MNSDGFRVTRDGHLFDVIGNSSVMIERSGIVMPMPTIAAAISNAISGDTILLGPGTFDLEDQTVIPENVTLSGMGIGVTVLNFTGDLTVDNDGVCLIPSTNSKVGNLSILCPESNGTYGAAFGVNGTTVDRAAASGWLVYNVEMRGETDCVYVFNDNSFSGSFINCKFQSKWDTIALFCRTAAGSAHELFFQNCEIFVIGPNAIQPTKGNCLVAWNDFLGNVEFVGCHFINMGVASDGAEATIISLSDDSDRAITIRLTGCRIDNRNSAATSDVYMAHASHSVYVTGSDLLPSRVSDLFAGASVHWLGQGVQERVTTAVRDGLMCLTKGLMIYNTTTNKLNMYNGSAWEAITSA